MVDGQGRGPTVRSFRRRAGRVMLTAVSVLLGSVLVLSGVLLLWSPGQPTPFLDSSGKPLPGSISEKIHVNINGVEQGMFIKGKDSSNPVLLYLHGGMPDYFLTQDYPTGLDEYFTVVWWEQRGSGLSYSPDVPPESVNPDQLVSDTLSVTNYLRGRFGQQKIYLMGHSGGTFTGIQVAARAPELFSAYIGVAQMSNQLESEKLACAYMLRRFKRAETRRWRGGSEKHPSPTRSHCRIRTSRCVIRPCTASASARPTRWSPLSPACSYRPSRTVSTRWARRSACGAARSSPAASCGTPSSPRI